MHWVSITTAVVGGVWSLSASRDNAYIFIFGLILAVQNFMRLQGARPIMLHPGYDGALVDGPAARERRPGRMGGLAWAQAAWPARTAARAEAGQAAEGQAAERLARGFALLGEGRYRRGACAEAEAVRDAKPTPEHRALAGELIAWSFLQERNVPKARAAIVEVPDRSVLRVASWRRSRSPGPTRPRGAVGGARPHRRTRGPRTRQVIDYVGRRDLGVAARPGAPRAAERAGLRGGRAARRGPGRSAAAASRRTGCKSSSSGAEPEIPAPTIEQGRTA